MRVLMIAYQCARDWGSEPKVGWSLLRGAAMSNEVTLLTQPRYVEGIAAAIAEEGLPPVKLVSVPGFPGFGRFEGRLGVGHVDYVVWQCRAWGVARRLQRDFDVAHHATFVNDWLPCAALFLRHVPVVWGPVGGTAPFPWRLLRYLSLRGLAQELVREIVTRASRSVTKRLVRRCRCVVVSSNQNVAANFSAVGVPIFVEPAVALPPVPVPIPARQERRQERRKQAVFVGRLSAFKGPYLALATVALLPPEWHLEIFGTGPEISGIERRARRLGLAGRVRLAGHRPTSEVQESLERADVLLFPSMHDSSPRAVAEAVRLGCPVVCLDVTGPPLLIAGTSGAAVRPDARAPHRLADAVLNVRRDPPSDRWNIDRLADRVNEWYEHAQSKLPLAPP